MNDNQVERRRISSDDHIELSWIKKVLIGGVIALMAHFAAGIWWAATITANYNSLRSDISRISIDFKESISDRYRGSDAIKDFSVVMGRVERSEFRIGKLEDRVQNKQGGTS